MRASVHSRSIHNESKGRTQSVFTRKPRIEVHRGSADGDLRATLSGKEVDFSHTTGEIERHADIELEANDIDELVRQLINQGHIRSVLARAIDASPCPRCEGRQLLEMLRVLTGSANPTPREP